MKKEALERCWLYSCTHDKEYNICPMCHWKECKKWYRLGKKDERKRLKK